MTSTDEGGSLATARANDLELVERLLSKDRSAWTDFVQQFQGLVYARVKRSAMGLRRHASNADIEDICADVFTRLLARDFAVLRGFAGRSSLATWLCVIAHRTCVRHYSKRREEPSAEWEVQDSPDTATDALAKLIQSEEINTMHAKLDLLSQDDRRILLMYFQDGLGYSEISRRFSISINTVGPKIHRAQERLRKLMQWT